ncbi:MAG: ornithine cyclodeaminase family protein [Rhizobiales bacterium]|nr:ornithine cyclodeaminase family protein [Hyphomicrobiales bacterium]
MSMANNCTWFSILRGDDMIVITEAICQKVIDNKNSFVAVEGVFASMASGDAYNFPVIREDIGYADAIYGFKSGFDKTAKTLGLKSGGYWPGNMKNGLTNHQSTIFLFNADTGQIKAMVGGNYLTAMRTAAASSVSIEHLARKNSKVLGFIGAGHQSTFQLRAAVERRNFEKVVAWNLHKEMLPNLQAVAEELGLAFEAMEREEVAAQSDVIITITSAHEALLMKSWIKPGTHIACMGTDTKGKQEIDPEIFAVASVFTDEVAQSISIGEAQHAIKSGIIFKNNITPIGNVINADHIGRKTDSEITIFDGTGVGLQDLAVAEVAVVAAKKLQLAKNIDVYS